jgi:hypothetical protein
MPHDWLTTNATPCRATPHDPGVMALLNSLLTHNGDPQQHRYSAWRAQDVIHIRVARLRHRRITGHRHRHRFVREIGQWLCRGRSGARCWWVWQHDVSLSL